MIQVIIVYIASNQVVTCQHYLINVSNSKSVIIVNDIRASCQHSTLGIKADNIPGALNPSKFIFSP